MFTNMEQGECQTPPIHIPSTLVPFQSCLALDGRVCPGMSSSVDPAPCPGRSRSPRQPHRGATARTPEEQTHEPQGKYFFSKGCQSLPGKSCPHPGRHCPQAALGRPLKSHPLGQQSLSRVLGHSAHRRVSPHRVGEGLGRTRELEVL